MSKEFWDEHIARAMPEYVEGMEREEFLKAQIYNPQHYFCAVFRHVFNYWPVAFFSIHDPHLRADVEELYQDLEAASYHAGT